MQFNHKSLRQRSDGHGFFDFGSDIAHPEFQRAKRRMRADVPPDFLAGIDTIETYQQIDEIFVGAPRFKLFGNTGARKTTEHGGTKRFQAGVAAHPEWRACRKRQQVRQEIAHHVHHIDGGLLVGHGHVYVHAENQQGTSKLLELFHDVLIAFAWGDDLIDPTGKRMGARGSYLQTRAFSCSYQFAACAVHFDAQLADIFADARTGFHDGLVHFVFDLIEDIRRGRGDQLHHVRAQLARHRIYDLKFFLDADGEAVSHGVALREPWGCLRSPGRQYHTPLSIKSAPRGIL